MINKISICIITVLSVAINTSAQVGVGTTTPNSTLDVRGSLSVGYRTFSTATSAAITDNTLVFTGTSAATLTLPDATACTGRVYWVKNTSSNASTLTLATTSSQTIDGLSVWTLTQTNKAVQLVSDGTNWLLASESLPGNSGGTSWIQGGNSVSGSFQNFGTTSNKDLPFITNSTERMRITNSGNIAIGTSSFNGPNPEKFVVDAGTTSSVNAIVGKGTINSYLQLNIQNLSNGNSASSDVVATADNGNETTNFVDMGINSSTNNSGVMGAANDAYLYNLGQNFLIGTGVPAKSLIFMTGGTTQSSNERMRIDGSGNVGIGVTNPSYKLHIAGTNPLFLNGVQTGAGTDSLLTIINGVVKKLHPSALTVSSSNAWALIGNASTNPATNFIGTTDAQALVVKVNNTQVGRFEQNSMALGIGSTTNNSTQSYAVGSSANVGFGHTNAYAIGNSAAVNTDNSFSIGNSAVTNGSNSFAIGNSAAANNTNSLAIGLSAVTAYSITDAIAIGDNATANNSNSIAIGSNSTLANKTVTNAANAIAIGNTAVSNSASSIAIGTGALVNYSISPAVAIGNSAVVNGNSGVAIGNGANIANVSNATALGAGASATSTANNSTAIGYNASATLPNEIILGDRSNIGLAIGIGTESFSGTNREKLLVDNGTSTSVNAIVGRGNNNNYLQLNIQNQNNGTLASSDVVATADNGNETTNYIDMGINSSGYSATGILGGANNAYLYTTGNDFVIGNNTNNKSLIFYTTTAGNNIERMRITNAGLIPGQDNTYSSGNTTNRWTAVWAANGTIQTSDIRLKKNIHPLVYGLNEIMKLQPVSYDWKDNTGANKIGLIAQEVRKVIPQVVVGNEEKENLGMNYAELVPVLINAIKELNKKVESLEAAIEKLKK
jgi:Chaperone of endosialidase/Head domain of trimeric autotransporter adhesin